MNMYIVVPVRQPIFLFQSPLHLAYQACQHDHRHHRLNIFEERFLAQRYIAEQRRDLLLLAFRGMLRNDLLAALTHRQPEPVTRALLEMTYYPRASSPQRIPFYRDRRNYDLNAAVEASNALQANRGGLRRQQPLDFRSAANVPNDFRLPENILADLRRGKYMDLVAADEVSIDEVAQFACVPVNGIYQIYKKEDLIQHIKTRGAVGREEFRDIATNARVKMNDVFTLTPQQLRRFAEQHTVALADNVAAAVSPVANVRKR